jgi:hypothetical protein
MKRVSALRLLLCGAALLPLAPPAAGQAIEPPLDPPRWVGDAAGLGVNALLGGLTAGLMQSARGGSFQDGFARGMLGGAVIYAGKRVAVERFAGAGLLGREVAAVGVSVVRNAAEARPSLERLMLPLGPVRLYVHTDGGLRVRPKLDAATLLAAGFAAAAPELEWDAGDSWSTGAPVFRVEDLLIRGRADEENPTEIGASGITRAGAIYLSDVPGLDYAEDFAHERVHLIQNDQFFWMWTAPAEEWLLERIPGGERVGRYLDLNLSPLVTRGLSLTFRNYERRPWELEAEFLARGR